MFLQIKKDEDFLDRPLVARRAQWRSPRYAKWIRPVAACLRSWPTFLCSFVRHEISARSAGRFAHAPCEISIRSHDATLIAMDLRELRRNDPISSGPENASCKPVARKARHCVLGKRFFTFFNAAGIRAGCSRLETIWLVGDDVASCRRLARRQGEVLRLAVSAKWITSFGLNVLAGVRIDY